MTEKYIRLFQNPEAWSDYRRTCIPALTPASGTSSIPARLGLSAQRAQREPQHSGRRAAAELERPQSMSLI